MYGAASLFSVQFSMNHFARAQQIVSQMPPRFIPPNSRDRRRTALMPVKSKAMATPAKAQGGEVDYKAKIDAAMEAFTAKVTRGPAPCTLCALHPAPVTDLEP